MLTPQARLFFEGMPLGNEVPLSISLKDSRKTKGFTEPGMSDDSQPLIGSMGNQRQIQVKAMLTSSDGDFLTWLELIDGITRYLKTETRVIERRAQRNHDPAAKKLGRLAYVIDVNEGQEVATVSQISGSGIGYGTIRFVIGSSSGLSIGDHVVITEDAEVPSVGEIGEVTDVAPTSVDIVSRLTLSSGQTPYQGKSLLLHKVAGHYPGVVYRDYQYTAPSTLTDGGSARDGVTFLFESAGDFVRAGSTIGSQQPLDGWLWSSMKFGETRHGV